MQSDDVRAWQYRLSKYDDQIAFEKIYLHFFQRLLSFAVTFVKEKMIAEEIVEDVLIKIWQNRRQVASIRNLQVYLFVATRNRSLNYLEWKSGNIIEYLERYPENIHASYRTPESRLITHEMSRRINDAVDRLPPKCKMIFKLVREEGLKYREVAEVLNISPRTVDTQMTIAMKKLSSAITLYKTPKI